VSSPYVGQLALVGFNFAPVGWALCAGQLVQISENPTLFNLLGTIYGGDGMQTFGLPNLCGRTPIHQGNLSGGSSYAIGTSGGAESVTLTTNQLPMHNHSIAASGNPGASNLVASNVLAGSGANQIYSNPPIPSTALNASTMTAAGGSQPHSNLQPYLVCNWIISLFGVYPTQT